jgi:hypothetical protein
MRRTVRLRVRLQLTSLGHRCDVVAPSLIPTKSGEPPLHRDDSNGLTENPTAAQGGGVAVGKSENLNDNSVCSGVADGKRRGMAGRSGKRPRG